MTIALVDHGSEPTVQLHRPNYFWRTTLSSRNDWNAIPSGFKQTLGMVLPSNRSSLSFVLNLRHIRSLVLRDQYQFGLIFGARVLENLHAASPR